MEIERQCQICRTTLGQSINTGLSAGPISPPPTPNRELVCLNANCERGPKADLLCAFSRTDRQRLLNKGNLSPATRATLSFAAGVPDSGYETGLTQEMAVELLKESARLGMRKAAMDLDQGMAGLEQRRRGH